MRIDHFPTVEETHKARACNYKPIGEQLDVIYKLAAALRAQGLFLPQEVNDWIDHCKSVKTRFPV